MAQATTTKRSAITVEQQFRWYCTYEQALDLLRELNAGVCQKTGKTFGELIANFIVAGDETGLSGMEGAVRIVGSRGKSKQEKIIMIHVSQLPCIARGLWLVQMDLLPFYCLGKENAKLFLTTF